MIVPLRGGVTADVFNRLAEGSELLEADHLVIGVEDLGEGEDHRLVPSLGARVVTDYIAAEALDQPVRRQRNYCLLAVRVRI